MDIKGSTSKAADSYSGHDWAEILCPICMEHPHNAVLLICSSHEKGCRSYICDTSYRHSNCLDRFIKVRENVAHPGSSLLDNLDTAITEQRDPSMPGSFYVVGNMRRNLVETNDDYTLEGNNDEMPQGLLGALEDLNFNQPHAPPVFPNEERMIQEESVQGKSSELDCLTCPLCRGTVMGWMVMKEARQYWDLKSRSCCSEPCAFNGNYRELRRHAREVHPSARPTDVDPTRQRAWRRLEYQQEHGDILSAIRSAMPGAVVLGDYVLDRDDWQLHDHDNIASGDNSRPWWTTFLLLQMISRESTDSPRPWRRRRRTFERQRNAWRERLLGITYEDDEDRDGDGDGDGDGEDGEDSPDDDVEVQRQRRRITRSNPI